MAAELELFINSDGSVSGTDGENVILPIDVNGHLVGKTPVTAAAPQVANGAQLISGATLQLSGSDSAMQLSGQALASGNAAGALWTVTFSVPFTATPHIGVEELSSAAKTAHFYISAKSATGFTVSCLNALAANQAVSCDVLVVG